MDDDYIYRPATGLTDEEVEERARRHYESMPNASIFPTWDDLPDWERQVDQKTRDRYGHVPELFKHFSKQMWRQKAAYAASWMVAPDERVVKL